MHKHHHDRQARHQGSRINTDVIQIEVQPICSSQYAEARSNLADLQSKPTKIISMPRHTSLNTTYWIETRKYLSVIMSICTIWSLLVVKSSAQDVKSDLSVAKRAPAKVISRQVGVSSVPVKKQQDRVLAQNSDSISTNTDINKDLRLQGITITQDSADKSLLTVKGFINNRSEQAHYVYYIVAKFIANDTAIKQTVIPVNIDIEPGQSKPFIHEISTDSVNLIVPATVKPVVVKYEYR
jgi:hypothetical protein